MTWVGDVFWNPQLKTGLVTFLEDLQKILLEVTRAWLHPRN